MFVDPLAEETMEPYLYTGNNPIMFTDPTGMSKDDIVFKDTSGNETGRIETSRINKTIVTNSDLGKININLDEIEKELGEQVQAVGVYSEGSITVGGGMFKGKGAVMMLGGEDAFKPKSFSTIGSNVGFEGSVGFGVEPFVSVLNPDFKDTHYNLDKYSGNFNGYSGSFKNVGTSFTWSNERNSTDQLWPQSNNNSNSLISAHRNNRYTWKTYSVGASFSLKTLFTKFNGGVKYMGGELKY